MFGLILTAGVALLSGYFFWRFHAACPRTGWWNLAVLAGLALVAGGRYWGRALARAGWPQAGEAVRLVLVVWLVLLFWFLCLGLGLQLWNGLAWLGSKGWPQAARLRVGPRVGFFLVSGAVVAAGLWAFFEARRVSVRHVVVEVDALPAGYDVLRIAQISDVHVGSAQSRQRVEAAVALLRQLQPDLIVSTGDLVDGELHEIDHVAERFGAVEAPLGKFAVLGNHEVYTGIDDSMTFHRRAGLRVLRGEAVTPVDGLRLVGVDDPAVRRRGGQPLIDELRLLPESHDGEIVILLKHQPEVAPGAAGRFDLQLSGHTHGGQVFPFGLLTRLLYPLGFGRVELPGGSIVYVSRGTGTWGPPLRLAARPEVTLIELRRRPTPP